MKQLLMYRLPEPPLYEEPLPAGYSFSNYKSPADIEPWLVACRKGLTEEDADESAFWGCMNDRPGLTLERDVFFLDYAGEHIATITAYRHDEDGTGDLHMLAIREDFRGRGLSGYLLRRAVAHLRELDAVYYHLTTDDWRKPAVKEYLRLGFLPVNWDTDMETRWTALLRELAVDSVLMLNEDTTPYKKLFR